MKSVEAVFERGILRPLAPLNIEDGTVVRIEVPDNGIDDQGLNQKTDWDIVQDIIALPLENSEVFSGADHDETLYGWKKSKK